MIEIKLFKKVDMAGCTLIEGFPGIGLVGPMSISYMASKLGMEYIGYLQGTVFPPIVSIHGDVPMPPCRIYHSRKYKVAALFAESNVVSENAIYEMAERLHEFVVSNKVAQILSLSGLPVENPSDQGLFALASKKELVAKFGAFGLKSIGEGVAAGVSALMLMYASMEGMDDINILVPVNPQVIDPRYAEVAISAINRILGLAIDTSELDKEAAVVEERIKSILKRSREAKEPYEKKEAGPSMYA